MKSSDNLQEAKERLLERVLLGTALAVLAGYAALAIKILRYKGPSPAQK